MNSRTLLFRDGTIYDKTVLRDMHIYLKSTYTWKFDACYYTSVALLVIVKKRVKSWKVPYDVWKMIAKLLYASWKDDEWMLLQLRKLKR